MLKSILNYRKVFDECACGIGTQAVEGGRRCEAREVERMLSRLVKELREEGRIEGRIEAIVEATIDVLGERFGDVPEDVREKFAEVNDLRKLKALFRKSLVVKSMDEFRKLMKETV